MNKTELFDLTPIPRNIRLKRETCRVGDQVVLSEGDGWTRFAEHSDRIRAMFRIRRFMRRPRDATTTVLTLTGDASLSDQEYRLEILPTSIALSAATAAGMEHAVSTLAQLIRCQPNGLRCCHIRDEPDIARRGVLLDLRAGRVPARQSFDSLIDGLAELKINELWLAWLDEAPHADAIHVDPDTVASAMNWPQLREKCRSRSIDLYVQNEVCSGLTSNGRAARPSPRRLNVIGRLSPAEDASFIASLELRDAALKRAGAAQGRKSRSGRQALGKEDAVQWQFSLIASPDESPARGRTNSGSANAALRAWRPLVQQSDSLIPQYDLDVANASSPGSGKPGAESGVLLAHISDPYAWRPLAAAYPILAKASAMAWCARSNKALDAFDASNIVFCRESSPKLIKMWREVEAWWSRDAARDIALPHDAAPGSLIPELLRPFMDQQSDESTDWARRGERAHAGCRKLIESVEQHQATTSESRLIRRELLHLLRLAEHAIRRMSLCSAQRSDQLDRDTIEDMTTCIKHLSHSHRLLWLARNASAGLLESREPYELLMAEYHRFGRLARESARLAVEGEQDDLLEPMVLEAGGTDGRRGARKSRRRPR